MTELLAQANNFNNSGQNTAARACGWGMMAGPGMMGWWPGMGGGLFGGIFSFLLWLLAMLVLAALFRWLWWKGTGEKKKE